MPEHRKHRHTTEPSCWQAAVYCAIRAKRLSEREYAFIRNILQLTGRGQRLSVKQQVWLRDIYIRLGGPWEC